MFKLSIPMSIGTINEDTLPIYLDYVKKCKAERVFLCGMGEIYTDDSSIYNKPEQIREVIKAFKNCGVETGIWVNTLGHGVALIGSKLYEAKGKYTSMEGVMGDKPTQALCPAAVYTGGRSTGST